MRANCMQFKYYLEKQIKVLALKFSNSQIYQPKAALSLSTVIHFDFGKWIHRRSSRDLKTLRLSRNICVKLLNFPKFQLGLKYYFHFFRL